MNREGEIIIECGVDGGTLILFGIEGANGWRFRATKDEIDWDLEFHDPDCEPVSPEFRRETDKVGPWESEAFAPRRTSDWVDSLEAALALFDKYPWHSFFMPIAVHPSFAWQIWAAVEKRVRRDKRERFLCRLLPPKLWHLFLFHPEYSVDETLALLHRDDWHRLCHGGGRASAYRDF
jgi:hypothetical protein